MLTQELNDKLSEFLNIPFKFPNRLKVTCGIFSTDNSSYISYEAKTKSYSFLLCYGETHFSFDTKSLEFEEILEGMKRNTLRAEAYALSQSQLRSKVYEQLSKKL